MRCHGKMSMFTYCLNILVEILTDLELFVETIGFGFPPIKTKYTYCDKFSGIFEITLSRHDDRNHPIRVGNVHVFLYIFQIERIFMTSKFRS